MISFKKISHAMLGNGLEFIQGFGLTAYVTLQYSMEEAGEWMWLMALAAIHAKIREGLTQAALFRLGCSGDISKQLIFRKLTLIITVLFECFGCLLALCMAFIFMPSMKVWWLLYPAFTIGTAFYRWQYFFLQGSLKIKRSLQLQAMQAILVLGTLSWTFLQQLPAYHLVVGLALAKSVALLPFFNLKGIVSMMAVQASKADWMQIKSYVQAGFAREVLGSVAARAELIIGALLLSFSEIAWLGLAARYAQLLLLPNGTLQSLLFASVCQASTSKRLSQKVIAQLGAGLIGLCSIFSLAWLFLAISSPWWVTLLHGESYLAALPIILIILAQTALLAPIGGIFGIIAYTTQHPDLTTRAVVQSSTIKLLMMYPLLYVFGIWGAIGLSLAVEIAGVFFANYLMQKKIALGWVDFINAGFKHIATIWFVYKEKKLSIVSTNTPDITS